ncbi:MAG: LPS export ABC transporter permease LptF [Alphaproteobacteria bacterium]|nr:LPS export ABC transporter permease LptF [Alphaproteobacteria bacterium]
MLFHSSIRQELMRTFSATLVVLVTVVLTMMLIRTLGLASKGVVNPSEVSLILGYTLLGNLHIILTLSLFLSVGACLSRQFRDSEMVIWISSGVGLMGFLRPVLRFSWPVWLLIAFLVFWVWPWTHQQNQELRERYRQRGDLERVAPGLFQSSASGNRVFFIDKNTVDGQPARNVFISSQEAQRRTVTSARSGRLTEIEGERFLVLENGQQLELSEKDSSARLVEFQRLDTRIDTAPRLTPQYTAQAMTSADLWRQHDRYALAELAWRLGLVWSAVNLCLLAVAAARVNPRSARGGQILLGIFTFIVYFNLINLGQSWIANGKSDWLGHVFALHGSITLGTLALLAARNGHWHWRWRPARRRA